MRDVFQTVHTPFTHLISPTRAMCFNLGVEQSCTPQGEYIRAVSLKHGAAGRPLCSVSLGAAGLCFGRGSKLVLWVHDSDPRWDPGQEWVCMFLCLVHLIACNTGHVV